MTDAIVKVDFTEARALSKELALSNIIPMALRKKPEDVLAVVLTGQELGLGPMQSIRGLDLIQGKVSMSSQLIGALIMSHPSCEYLTPVEFTDKVATFETKRKGSPAPVRMSFTMEEATAAGLASKDNYKKNPVAMLLARAQARIGRAVYPDRCLGVYDRDSEELESLPQSAIPDSKQAEFVAAKKEELRAAVVEGEVVKTEPVKREPMFAKNETVQKLLAAINAAPTLDALKALGKDIVPLPQGEKEFLRTIYKDRKEVLSK